MFVMWQHYSQLEKAGEKKMKKDRAYDPVFLFKFQHLHVASPE
jgi:hypothetical protein